MKRKASKPNAELFLFTLYLRVNAIDSISDEHVRRLLIVRKFCPLTKGQNLDQFTGFINAVEHQVVSEIDLAYLKVHYGRFFLSNAKAPWPLVQVIDHVKESGKPIPQLSAARRVGP